MIDKIREIVRKDIPDHDWEFHTFLVVKHAIQLAKLLDEDEQLAEIAALFHDLGGYRRGWDKHEIKGAEEAEKILTNLECDRKIIEEIKHCILAHRSNGSLEPKTKLAKILRDADALSHFDAVPYLIYLGLYRNKNDINKAVKWVLNKLERDYNQLYLPESKKLAENNYNAAMLLLRQKK